MTDPIAIDILLRGRPFSAFPEQTPGQPPCLVEPLTQYLVLTHAAVAALVSDSGNVFETVVSHDVFDKVYSLIK